MQPIHNARDLMEAWWIDWGVQKDSQIAEVLKFDKFSPLAKLAPQMQFRDWEKDKEWIKDKAGNSHYAWIATQEELKWIISRDYLESKDELCRLHLAADMVYRSPVYFAFAPNSENQLITAFNLELEQLGMTGMISHFVDFYANLGNDCLKPNIIYAGDVRKIEMLHMYGSYMVLGCGLIGSLGVLLMEIVYMSWSKGQRRTNLGRGSPSSQEELLLGGQKDANLNFVHDGGHTEGAGYRKGGNTKGLRPLIGGHPLAPAQPGLPPQYSTIYENTANNAYSTPSSFNYYDFDKNMKNGGGGGGGGGGATNFKSNFGIPK